MAKYTHRTALEQFKHHATDQSGYVPDDIPYSDLDIVTHLLQSRAVVTQRALKQALDVSEFMIQTLGCLEVEEMDRAEHPSAPASGCYWLKSKAPIPETIIVRSVTGIVSHGEMPRFNPIKWDKFQYIPKSRVSAMARGRYWTIRDTGNGPYLYLYGDRFLERVSMSAIFENPMEAAAFPACGEVDIEAKCNPLDVDFYTDAWMRDEVIAMAWQRILAVRRTALIDRPNDDNPPAVPPQQAAQR